MHALEWMLSITALLGVLALLASGINTHHGKWETTQTNWNQNQHALECSSQWDRSNSHFIVTPKGECIAFPFALHADGGPSFLMGMDGNHYE